MKVLQVVRQYKPVIGGMENYVDNFSMHLQKLGIVSEVLTLDRDFSNGERFSSHSEINGIKVTRIPYFGSRRYPIALSTIKYLAKFDIIHIHGVDFFFDYLAFLKIFHRKPIILTTHGGFFHTKNFLLYKKLHFQTITKLSLKQTNKVVAVSQNDYNSFKPLAPDKTSLIECGIDFDTYHKISEKPGKKNRMIFVGRFSNNKRIDKLLEVIKELKADFPDIHLSIVGKDFDQLKKDYVKQIQEYEISNHVEIMEALSQEELLKEMAQCTYFISASEYEGFGLSSLEAMAAGRIPLLNSIPSFKKMVDDGENGYLLNFDDMDAVVAKMKTVLRSNHKGLKEEAIERARKNSWNTTVNHFKEIYQDAYLNGRSQKRKVRVEAVKEK
ncbi:glycosyltransferase family 4 protein [Bacillus timonensis]|nr:glycosyltransferase family 4 protein [Bacillus timonensis]